MRARTIFLLITFSLLFTAEGAVRWNGSFDANIEYDNNIFYLSPADLQKFRLGENPARYPYHSADDVDLKVTADLRGVFTRNTGFRLRLRLHQYVVNQEKSYGLINTRIEQEAGKLGRFFFSYIWMPNYLIRYYPDPEIKGGYFPCRYGEHLFGIDFHRGFGNLLITSNYRFEIDDYLKRFDYYDTRAHRLGVELGWRPRKNINLQGEYQFKIARAKGPVPDISYQEHRFEITIATRPRVFDRFGVEAGYRFCHRQYTTDNPITIDPYHYGRVDRTQTIAAGGDFRLNPFTLVLKYELEWREVDSPYNGEVEEVKEYRASRVSLGVNLPLTLDSKRKKD